MSFKSNKDYSEATRLYVLFTEGTPRTVKTSHIHGVPQFHVGEVFTVVKATDKHAFAGFF